MTVPNVPKPLLLGPVNGYWIVVVSEPSWIETIWCMAEPPVSLDTLTNDLTAESISLLVLVINIGVEVPVWYVDSNLPLLSAPAGWPGTANL